MKSHILPPRFSIQASPRPTSSDGNERRNPRRAGGAKVTYEPNLDSTNGSLEADESLSKEENEEEMQEEVEEESSTHVIEETPEEETTPPTLYHFNRYKSATISAGLAPGKTIGDGIKEMEAIADKLLDESFNTALSGNSRDFAESSGNTFFVLNSTAGTIALFASIAKRKAPSLNSFSG